MSGKTDPVYAMPNGRFRTDDTQAINSTGGWNGALNANITQGWGKLFRWRVEVEETAGGSGNNSFRLEFRYKVSTGSFGAWTAVTRWDAGGTVHPIQVWASSQFSDGAATTNILSGSTQGFTGGFGEWDVNTANVNLSNTHTEFEFTLLLNRIFESSGGSITEASTGDVIELRMTDGGTALGGTVNSPQITFAATSGNIGGTSPETGGRWFWADGANLYAIIEDGEPTGIPTMQRSTDAGVSWAEVDGANRPTSPDMEGIDGEFLTDRIHIGQFTRNDTAVYHQFLTASATGSANTWNITDETITTGNGLASADFQCIALVPRSDGSIVALYNGHDGTNGRIYYSIRASTGGWTTGSILDNTASTNFQGVVACRGESDLTHVFYANRTTQRLIHKTISSTDGVSSPDNVTSTGIIDASPLRTFEVIKPVYYDDAGVEVITVGYRDQTASNFKSVQYRDNSIQSALTVTTGDVQADGGAGGQPQVFFDVSGTDVWAAVVPLSDKDLDRTNSADGGSWAALTAVTTGINVIFTQALVWTSTGGDTILGMLYDDDEQLETGNFGGYTGRIFYTSYTIAEGGGGTTYSQSNAGALSFAGAIVLQPQIKHDGVLSFAGDLAVQIKKALAGALSFAGGLVKQTQTALDGALSFAGDLVGSLKFTQALAGALSFAGGLTQKAQKQVSGGLSFAGGLTKQTRAGIAGALSFAGDLVKQTQTGIAGALSFAGGLSSRIVIQRAISGALSFAGEVSKKAGIGVSGVLSFAGDTIQGVRKTLAGSISFVGGLAPKTLKSLSGALSFGGDVVIKTKKLLAGVLSFAGGLAGVLQEAGGQFSQSVGGALSFAGSLARKPKISISGALSFAGGLVKKIGIAIAGGLDFSGYLQNDPTDLPGATWTVGAESRSWQPGTESRAWTIETESRSWQPGTESRAWTVGAEARSWEVDDGS